MAALSGLILLLLAVLAFAFVIVVARHFPEPAGEAAAAGGAAPHPPMPGPFERRSRRRRLRAALGRSLREIRAFLRSLIPGRRFAYTVPWFLLIGDSGVGKTTLLDGVEHSTGFVLPPPQHLSHPGLCNWRFFDAGVVLDVNGAIIIPPHGGRFGEDGGWHELLRLLRNYRPLRPLDGVVLAVSCEDLVGREAPGTEALGTMADAFYQRIWGIQQQLGLRLPVYLILTKADLIAGFGSFAQALVPLHGSEILGWSNPGELDAPLTPQLAGNVLAEIAARLRRIHLDIAADTDDPADGDGLLVFPGAVQRLAAPLQLILNSVFRPSAYHEPFFLRGIYLVGGGGAAAEPAGPQPMVGMVADERGVAGEARAIAAPRPPIFVQDLFREKIFAETALAGVARHGPVHQARNVRIAQVALVLFVVLAGAGLAVETIRLQRGLDSLIPAFTAVDQGLASLTQSGGASNAHAARDAGRYHGAEAFLNGLAGNDLNNLWSPLLPTSWFSNLESDAVEFLQAGFTQVLLPTIRHEIADRVQTSLDNLSGAASGTVSNPTMALAGSADFTRVDGSIRGLISLQSEAALFNQINSRPELHLVDRLSDDMLGIKVPPSFYQNAELYQAALSRSRVTPYEFMPIEPRARDAAVAAFKPIEARLSDSGPILADLTTLIAAFNNLEDASHSGVDSGAMMAGLIAALARTKAALDDPRLGWITSKSVKDIPELDGLLVAMSQSSIFGSKLADSLRNGLEIELRALQAKLAASNAPGIGPILDQANGQVVLKFSPPVGRLSDQLSAMLKYAFMTPHQDSDAVLAANLGRGVHWDADTLRTALDFYRGYEQFETSDLAAMPKALQKPLDDFARRRLQASMMKAVNDAMSSNTDASSTAVLDEGGVFNQAENFRRAAPVLGDILSVLNQLGFATSYEALRSFAVAQAYAQLGQVDQLADRDRLYLPQQAFTAVTGDTTSLQTAYLLHSDIETAQYLDAQRERIGRLAHGAAEPALGFLTRSDIAGVASMPLVGKWQGVLVALQAYQNGDLNGSVGALEHFIRFDLALANHGNCPIRSSPGAVAADFFGQRLEMLRRQVAAVCNTATVATTMDEYDRMASGFNRLLAGRYPFGPAGAAPAELAQVVDFFETFAANEAAVRASLAKSSDLPGTAAALHFLDQLDKVSAFFAPLLTAPSGGPASGYDMSAAFRVDRRHEHGADEIIDWSLTVGDTTVRSDHPTARWFLGDPITVRLRWAKDSPLTPYAVGGGDPQVDGLTAIFHAQGRWALVRLLRDHLAAAGDADPGSADAVPHLLKFSIPVSVPNTLASKPVTPGDQVIAYIGVGLTAPGATGAKAAALVLPDFPERAPELAARAPMPLLPRGGPRLSNYLVEPK